MIIFSPSFGQVRGEKADSLQYKQDSLLPSIQPGLSSDTIALPLDTVANVSDTTRRKAKNDIESVIKYNATDSLTLNLNDHLIGMYGKGKVDYGEIELTADNIHVNYTTDEITANGKYDSVGNEIDKPVFKQGDEQYETKDMRYNYKTKKAIIHGVVTQQGEGIMHGDLVKRDEFGDLYVDNAKYTTCDRPDPDFYIQATHIKVIPHNRIITGPFYLRVHDIPIPIGWGFGLFPQPRKKASGIIIPTYGEEQRRGFYLRGGGYYFAFNDYIDLRATGDLYSKGSWGINLASSYIKRYAFAGQFSFKYDKQKIESEGQSTLSKDFWITWSHTPKSKGPTQLSGNINVGSSTYNANNLNYYDITKNLNQEFSSNVSYSTSFTGTPFNLGMNARIQQNTQTGVYNIQLPDLSLSANRIYPFKGKSATSTTIWQKINFNWSMTGTNNISNNKVSTGNTSFQVENINPLADSIVPFNWASREILYDRMQNGIKHTIPLSTSTKFLKYFTLSPSVNYNEIWYFKRLNYAWDPDSNKVRIDTLRKFSRVYNYNAGAGITTKLYGTLNFSKGNILAIRHQMSPSIGVSFAPDFGSDKYNYYQTVQVDSTGKKMKLSRYNGFVYGTPTSGPSASLTFSLQNNLEMKVKTKKDTSDKATKIPILDNFGVSTGYNFLADSFNLSPFNFTARTSLFNKAIDLNLSWVVDPYLYILDSSYTDASGTRKYIQTQVNEFTWNHGKGLGQVSRFSFSTGYSFNPQARKKKEETVNKKNLNPDEQAELENIQANPQDYVDFNIPWDIRLNYNFNYLKAGFNPAKITQTLQANGSISVTKKWKVTYSTGYDFKQKQFVNTNFNITRDLHCWTMALTWVPFGRFQSYNITINAKSALLQDLKLSRRRSWQDR